MKTKIISFYIIPIFLLCSISGYAQRTFYYEFDTPLAIESGRMACIKNQNTFFITGNHCDSIGAIAYYGEINSSGQAIYTKSIEKHLFSSIITFSDTIYLLGIFYSDNNVLINFSKIGLDKNIKTIKNYQVPGEKGIISLKAFLNSRDEIVIYLSTFYDIKILVIDVFGNIITQRCYDNYVTFYDLIENPDKNSYTGLSLTDQYKFIVFDKSFEITNEYPGEYYFWLNNFKWINDSTLLNIGRTINDFVGVETLDNNFNQIKSHEFGAVDTVNYPAFFKTLLWPDDGNSFYIFTTKGVSTFHTRPGWLGLAKFNKESLEPEWIRYFGGSDFYYQALSIEQSEDGGILLQATRAYIYDEVRKEALVIIKTDTEGNFPLSIDNHSGEMQSQFTVFPNPGQELRIEASVEGALLELYNLNGQLLHTQSLSSGLNSINTDQLPPSTYIYRISLKKDLIGSGKWVKMK